MPARRDSSGRFIKGSGGTTRAAGGTVTDTDKGYRDTFRRLSETGSMTVGIHAAEGGRADGALTVAEIGTFHEFGLGVPRRSFIADWSDEKQGEHESQLRLVARAVVKGTVRSVDVGMQRLGNLYVGEVQRRIAENIAPPLSQATIDRKGSSVALIDKGILRSSITFKIGKGAGAGDES